MRSILEELFYDNVCPNTDFRSKDAQTKELMGYIADHHDALLKKLTDKQKNIIYNVFVSILQFFITKNIIDINVKIV